MKRAERRHHEERVKDRFRRAVKGHRLRSQAITAQVLQDEERQAVQMAHHPRHDCELCRMDRKSERQKREHEARKKAPLEDE